mmetsp:Transcript_45869/g.52901  ORF Transcript_45869/g.52901 Transcript_45869/m.52901 type:complete len:132 (-) Transcript_45869:39-434(-)
MRLSQGEHRFCSQFRQLSSAGVSSHSSHKVALPSSPSVLAVVLERNSSAPDSFEDVSMFKVIACPPPIRGSIRNILYVREIDQLRQKFDFDSLSTTLIIFLVFGQQRRVTNKSERMSEKIAFAQRSLVRGG